MDSLPSDKTFRRLYSVPPPDSGVSTWAPRAKNMVLLGKESHEPPTSGSGAPNLVNDRTVPAIVKAWVHVT